MTNSRDLPIACTLEGGSYGDRLAWIAELARDGLRGHTRHDLMLELRYAAAVAERVQEMVRQEQLCCAFLTFAIEPSEGEVRLTITAPERARDAADALFAQFLPAEARNRHE